MGEVPAGDVRFHPFGGRGPPAVGDPRGVGEQVADGDRLPRGHHVVGPVGVRARDGGLEVFREMAADRVRDQEPPLLLQHHDGHAHDRLGLGGDPEDVAGLERIVRLPVPVAEGLEVGRISSRPATSATAPGRAPDVT